MEHHSRFPHRSISARGTHGARVQRCRALTVPGPRLRSLSRLSARTSAGNEVRDPLTNGFTVGNPVGVTFIPGQGARLESQSSYIEYVLPVPLVEGEWSAEMTNVGNGGELVKTKVFSMMQGDGVNVTDNAYRVTLDKRPSVNCGAFRFTMRSRGRDAGEPNAGCQSWSRANFYLFKFEWRGGRADASVFDGGVNGFLKARTGTNLPSPLRAHPAHHSPRVGRRTRR